MSDLNPRDTLELILGHLGFVFEVHETRELDKIVLNIKTRDPGRLIGRDGHVLEDLQYLLNRLVGDAEDVPHRILVDVEGYRLKEQQHFLRRVKDIAVRVRRTGQPEKLPAMNSFDRRIVHQAFQDDPDVMTKSEDSAGRLKHILLLPRKTEGAPIAPPIQES